MVNELPLGIHIYKAIKSKRWLNTEGGNMGVRFRKSIKVAPGVKVNLNKKSTSVTVGGRGAHYTINSKGTKTTSVGIPGTGISYSETTSSNSSKKKTSTTTSKHPTSKNIPIESKYSAKTYSIYGTLMIAIGIFIILFGLLLLTSSLLGGMFVALLGVLPFMIGRKYKAIAKEKRNSLKRSE